MFIVLYLTFLYVYEQWGVCFMQHYRSYTYRSAWLEYNDIFLHFVFSIFWFCNTQTLRSIVIIYKVINDPRYSFVH